MLARRGTKIAIIIFNLKYDFRVMRFGLSAQRRHTHRQAQTTPKNVRATRRIKNISVSKVSGAQIMWATKLEGCVFKGYNRKGFNEQHPV